MLKELAKYGETLHKDLPKNYEVGNVHYIINLDSQSSNFVYTKVVDEYKDKKGKTKTRAKQMQKPAVVRTGKAIKPKFFCDNAQYVFGLDKQEPSQQKIRERRDQFKCRMELLAKQIDEGREGYATQAWRFLVADNKPPTEAKDSDVFMFAVDNINLVDLDIVQKLWAEEYVPKSKQESACIICSQITQERETIATQVVVCGQKSILFSIGQDSFESNNKKKSASIAVCSACEENIASAINHLSKNKANHYYLFGELFIWWTTEKYSAYFMELFKMKPENKQVLNLFKSVYADRNNCSISKSTFFMTSIIPYQSRLRFSNLDRLPVNEVRLNVANYFYNQRLEKEDNVFYSCNVLAMSLYPSTVTKKHPLENNKYIVNSIVRYAIFSHKLPKSILTKILRRVYVQVPTRPHLALLRSWLVSNQEIFMEEKIGLDEQSTNVGYVCGRLLYELDNLQKQAIENINVSIGTKYYKHALTSPAKTFVSIIKKSRSHLSKLEKRRKATFFAIESNINALLEIISEFPEKFTIIDQAFFVLGYAHQQSFNIQRAKARKEQNAKAKQSSSKA